MPRTLNRLKARQIETLPPGRHADGGGLYLDRSSDGRARWIFMWSRHGIRREMGLGSAGRSGVSLAKARELAGDARTLLVDGLDPIEVRRAKRAEAKTIPTFAEFADQIVRSLSPQWRNDKHIAQWKMTLSVYARPIADTRVDKITTTAVLALLQPIWLTRPETASRVRGRIERVLDAAKAMGFREGENPARWRGHLDLLLPARHRLTRGHHSAMAYDKVPDFMRRLREREAVSAAALEFLILTAARSGEVMGATWSEIDLEARVWTVSADRMKAGRDHRVPLSSRAVSILKRMERLRTNGSTAAPVFPGQSRGHLSTNAFGQLMARMGETVTIHGFRSSFRDWAGEVSDFPREVAEAALAHVVGDATERAYRRGDALEKRRVMMEAWAEHLEPRGRSGNVVAFARR